MHRSSYCPSQAKHSVLRSLLLALFVGQQVLGQDHTVPQLNGVGMVQSPTSTTGIWGTSLAGGAEVFIYGQKLSMTPSSNIVRFVTGDTTITGPPLSKDNEFLSNTGVGKLQYTTPSVATLFNAPMASFHSVDSMLFYVTAMGLDSTGTAYNNLACPARWDCSIVATRSHTPVLYFLSPPVVYHGAMTAISVDPKWALGMKNSDDWPFTEARIDNYTIDFQQTVSASTTLWGYQKNQVLGMVGDQPPAKDSAISMKFAAGLSIIAPDRNVHCSYDGSDCYHVRTVPSISAISAHAGYTSGGQLLTLSGNGLNGTNVDVAIDGTPCKVQTQSKTQITCITGSRPSVSTNDTDTVGQHGLRRRLYNNSGQSYVYPSSITQFPYTEVLAMHLESAQDNATYYGNVYSGWFKAPASTNYKFYMSCDDGCELRMGSTNMSSANPTLILSNYQAVVFRNYWDPNGKLNSTWLPLVKDTYYFMEVRHAQGGGAEHVSVAVEIQTSAASHPNTLREVQRLQISPTIVRDQLSITITAPDAGSYVLQLLNPGTSTYSSVTVACSASASDMKSALAGFFSYYWGASISVAKTMTDASGAATTSAAASAKSVWLVTVLKALSSVSVTRILAQPRTTTSSIQLLLPAVLQLGNPPISGSFRVQCFKSDGTGNYTVELPTNTGNWQVLSSITDACTEYRDAIDIWEGPAFSSAADGRDIFLRFSGLNQDVPQFRIVSGTSSPVVANNAQYIATTPTPYGGTIFYDPIPFELLYTNETLPQVIVTLDSLPAVCAGLSCQYSYVSPPASVDSFSLSGSQLTIVGTSLPLALVSVTYSNAQCDVTTKSDTQIVCTVTPSPVSGAWTPQVRDAFGLVPVAAAAQVLVVTASSVSPSSALNPSGKSLLTISGAHFPRSTTDGNKLSVSFSDATVCDVQSTTSTSVTCLTRAFAAASLGQTLQLTVHINGESSASLSVSVSATQATVTALTPAVASPVLKTNLTIHVQSSYATTLSVADLSVRLVSTSDSSYFKQANVIDVDNVNKLIIVKFGGAPSGTYSLEVASAATGLFNAAGVTLTTRGAISSVSPLTGSAFGGQLITISGSVFSDAATDNEVVIGGVNCAVVSSSASAIQCRTGVRGAQAPGTDDIIVSLKASEEAVCNAAGGCKYQWTTTDVPALSSFSAQFDPSLNRHTISFTGTGFTGDATSVQVYIDDIPQTVTSVTSTSVAATIVGLQGRSSSNIDLFFPIGSPSGLSILSSGLTLTPSLVSISPNIGSPAGSIITATVSGVGLGLADSINLVTSTGATLCSSVTITGYSQVVCKTKAATFATAAPLSVKVGASTYPCANLAASQCQYSTGASFPAVSGVAVSVDASRIELTGTSFYTAGYAANVTYAGVQADSVTIVSDTSAYATYARGVPATAAAVAPSLVFIQTGAAVAHWATGVPSLANAYIASQTATTTTCSFAGGCLLSVLGRGLASSLRNPAVSNITVCGQLCKLSESDSTALAAACLLPPLATQYSASQFNISMAGDITALGSGFSSNPLYTSSLFDGSVMNGWPSTASNCFAGVSYPAPNIGRLSQVKLYMNAFTPSAYVGKLRFEGSNDGTSYTAILTIGEELHTGWNYYDFVQDGTEPKYQYYRLFGTATGSCVVGELVLTGQVVIKDTSANYACTPSLSLNGTTSSLAAIASYQGALTPFLKSISPRFGTVKGGTAIVLSGTGFSTDPTKYTILIDGVACTPTAATATSVTCTSGKRPGLLPAPTLSIFISGQGRVSTQGLTYLYANLWSDTTTWGGEFQPMEGESVYIPAGLNLLVDVDSTPVLNAVLVEGSLIFPPDAADPSHQRTFDASYIFVNGGYMEVGTEQFPYTSRLTITMHGTKQSPEIPIYGNKVIGVRNGVLDLHGVARAPTWSELYITANPGSTSITLIEAVDWQAGEQIAIASTSLNAWEAEQVTIVSVDRTNANHPVVTVTPALQYGHYSGVETYGSQSITMRAEVGLLTRNVVFRGDPATSAANLYGAHIMLHSMGDESLIGRIENIECTDVGQAFQLGRYPIHFHMIGTVHQSYVRGNAIHQTYNRALTFHGVHYLRAIRNVAFNVMGHTFFVEDAAETNNLIDSNLAFLTKRSWSLLNTDQTPASFWITNPNNILRNNHAAGSDRYGFWFDLQPNPTGPSFDATICPDHMPLGEFKNNFAHSNGLYGIWVFHKHIPSTYPCRATAYDATNADPYWRNPPVTATISGFTTYQNGETGIMLEEIGDVRVVDARTADNIVAGIEISIVSNVRNGRGQVNGALVVGYSQNAGARIEGSGCWGVITSRSDYLSVNGVNFFRLDKPGMAALGSCSHCFHPAATDSGARTVTFSQLSFDSATVPRKINYQSPWRDIFYDLDGSLTGLGALTWATNYNWEHNDQPECTLKMTEYNGYVCDSSIEVRRIAFWNYAPVSSFTGLQINVLKYDDADIAAMDNATLTAYLADPASYSVLPFKPKKDPANGWAVPFVTNHKYKVHWAYGVDFNQMQCDISDQWRPSDHNLKLVFNFTEARARVNVTAGGTLIPNTSLTTGPAALLESGANVVYNDTATRQIHLVINGKNSSKTSLFMTGERCAGSCFGDVGEVNTENGTRYWSNTSSWPSGALPKEGEDVVIEPTWNMVLDLPITPVLKSLEIDGVLTFKASMNITLQSKIIFVRAGILSIGSPESPYDGIATILLHGEQSSQTVVYSDNIDTGNKMLANTAKISMYGQPRTGKVTRLLRTANVGDTQIYVETGLDWTVNDQIAIAANTMSYKASDSVKIVSYDANTGIAVVDKRLSSYHWGAAASTGPSYNGVDMRAEVVLLTRNVVLRGTDTEGWGCQFLTSDFVEASGRPRYGRTFLDHVEIRNCSQFDNSKAALRFQGALGGYSLITNSSIHDGRGWGFDIETSANVVLRGNVFYNFFQFGGLIQTASNLTIDRNLILHIEERGTSSLDEFVDKAAGLCICSYVRTDVCSGVMVTNNIVGGAFFYGYTAPGHQCGNYQDSTFKNNVAHSIKGNGVYIFPDANRPIQTTCMEGSFFSAYKCTEDGALTFEATQQAIFSYMTLIDNSFGAVVNIGLEADSLTSLFRHSMVYGETEAHDCPSQNYCKSNTLAACVDKVGYMVPYYQTSPKAIFPSMASSVPIHKVKEWAAWGGTSQVQNVTFSNFAASTTYCGTSSYVFSYGDSYSDYVPPAYFTGVTFSEVAQSAFARLYDPPITWAVIDDCGEFPCTAPKNGLLSFEQTKYKGGERPDYTGLAFQVVANNPTAVRAFKACSYVAAWNANICQNDYTGVLLFESVDGDKAKRTFSPMVIRGAADTYVNTLNEFMDHVWDSFYTGQLRLSRFPAVIQTGSGAGSPSSKLYNISYTGTPPGAQRFKLIAQNGALTVSIRYPKAGTYSVSDASGNLIAANAWSDKISAPAAISGRTCGENRFIGIVNLLEFYLTPGCLLQLNPVDSISGRIRLDWTLEAFYASGSSAFVDRFASVLGIPASSIKIVSVYKGSVNIVYTIAVAAQDAAASLQALQTKIAALISTAGPTGFASRLGAPVLDGDFGEGSALFQTGVAIVDGTKTNTTKDTTGTNSTTTTGGDGANKGTSTSEGGLAPTTQSSGGLSNSAKLAIIVSLIVLFVLVAAIVGVFVFRKHRADQQATEVKQDEFASSASQRPGEPEEEVYEPQYHPKAELGNIFGAGYRTDAAQDKANKADLVSGDEEQSPDKLVHETEGGDDIINHSRTEQSMVAHSRMQDDHSHDMISSMAKTSPDVLKQKRRNQLDVNQ